MGKVTLALLAASALTFTLLWSQGLSGLLLLHAGAMFTAWGLLIPAGTLVARYFKITPQQDFPRELDNQFWWNWHRVLQMAGVCISTVGFAAITISNGFNLTTNHNVLGFCVFMFGWCQILSGIFRGSKGGPTEVDMRGDHFDMTLYRRSFELVHKSLGWFSLALGCVAIFTGLDLAGMPLWVSLAAGTMLAGFLAMGIFFECQGRHVSTYLAIWGIPEPAPDSLRGRDTDNDRRS